MTTKQEKCQEKATGEKAMRAIDILPHHQHQFQTWASNQETSEQSHGIALIKIANCR
jgi:hypothetical protein